MLFDGKKLLITGVLTDDSIAFSRSRAWRSTAARAPEGADGGFSRALDTPEIQAYREEHGPCDLIYETHYFRWGATAGQIDALPT